MEDIVNVFKHVENLQQELNNRSKEFLDTLRLKFSGTAATVPTTKATARHMSCTSRQQTNDDENSKGARSQNGKLQPRVKLKRLKPASRANQAIAMKEAPTVPLPKNIIKLDPAVDQESTLENNATATSSSNTTTTVSPSTKKGKKKKPHRPFKVERLSDIIANPSPIHHIIKLDPAGDQESTLENNATATSSSNTTTTVSPSTKKGKKKKPHRPIKVERLSDIIANPSPISSRTRQGNVGHTQRQASVYEDAVAELPATAKLQQSIENAVTPPTRYSQVPKDVAIVAGVNETVTIAPSNTTMIVGTYDATCQVDAVQTTFVMPNNNSSKNATVTLSKEAIPGCDATFNISEERQQVVPRRSPSKDNQSMVTARNTSMPTRTHELFNPLVQNPVKKNVEAFEKLGKPGKENAIPTPTQSSYKTPAIGKQTVPTYGRFLTPIQTSNITPLATAQTGKLASSASKVMPFPKSVLSSSIQSAPSSAKAATLSRENSAEDFRRLAEERKKQRDQKHLEAQQLEAKEKERAERMAKVAKERQEKKRKKQREQMEQEQKIDDIQRKLKQIEQQQSKLKKQIYVKINI